jgi:hypothetical protein
VQVPLQPPPLGILSRDQTLPRSAQLLRQAHVAQSWSGLDGQVLEQRALGRRERLAGRLADCDLPHQCPLVQDWQRTFECCLDRSTWPCDRPIRSAGHIHQNTGARRTDTKRGGFRHPREHLIR